MGKVIHWLSLFGGAMLTIIGFAKGIFATPEALAETVIGVPLLIYGLAGIYNKGKVTRAFES